MAMAAARVRTLQQQARRAPPGLLPGSAARGFRMSDTGGMSMAFLAWAGTSLPGTSTAAEGREGGGGGGGHRQDWYSQHTQLLAAGWMAAGLWHTQASVVCRQSALQAVLPEQASACQSKPSSRFVGCRGLHADHGARRTCLCWVPPC